MQADNEAMELFSMTAWLKKEPFDFFGLQSDETLRFQAEINPVHTDGFSTEFEPWRQVTRFKNWKTSFRSEVIAGATHPRQVTEWLAEIEPSDHNADMDDT